MLKNNALQFYSRHRLLISLVVIFLLNVLLRLMGVFQEMPPDTFCDEDLYTIGSFDMYNSGTLMPPAFLSGGFSYYFPLFFAKVITLIFNYKFDLPHYIILSRLVTATLLSSLAAIFVFKTAILLFKKFEIGWYAALIMTFSPMALGLSRICYPDHFIMFFSAGALFYSASIMFNSDTTKNYIFAGIFIGFAIAVKVSGIYLGILLILAHMMIKIPKKDHIGLFLSWKLILGIVFIAIIFYIINPYFFLKLNDYTNALRWNVNHYKAGHPGLESNNGYLYYSKIVFLTSFGVLGSLLYLIGIYKLVRLTITKAVLLVIIPVVLIIMLGHYKVVVNRNMMLGLPFIFIVMGLGLFTLIQKIMEISILNSFLKHLSSILILIIFVSEPLFRTIYSINNDFKQDSRIACRKWIKKNIPKSNIIGVSNSCWGLPVDEREFNVRAIGMPAIYDKSDSAHIDYYVMDMWLYEIYGTGRSVFVEPVYWEHHFLNTGGISYQNYRKTQDAFLSNFFLIKTFSNIYYGPRILIYKNMNSGNRI